MEERFPRSPLHRLLYLPIKPREAYNGIQLALDSAISLKKAGFVSLTNVYVVDVYMLRLLSSGASGNECHLDAESLKIVIDKLELFAPAIMKLVRPQILEAKFVGPEADRDIRLIENYHRGSLRCLVPGCEKHFEVDESWEDHLNDVHPEKVTPPVQSRPPPTTWDSSSSEELVCW